MNLIRLISAILTNLVAVAMRTRPSVLAVMLVIATIVTIPACSTTATGPYQPPDETVRQPAEAERLTRDGVEHMESDPARAEELLRQALTADLYHGPAHNNLGVLHLNRGNLYEAAHEFEWARKLMPGHPDPRMNLGLTLERAGRVDDALDAYASALDVYPGHIPTIQALTLCEVRHGRVSSTTRDRIRQLSMTGSTPRWRQWAREQMFTKDDI